MYSRSALRLNYNTHYSSFLKRGTFVNTCINTQFFIYKTIIRNCLYNHFIKKLKGVTIYRINFNLHPPPPNFQQKSLTWVDGNIWLGIVFLAPNVSHIYKC